MRTVKASEVVKGMRVQVESIAHNVHVSIVGDVCEATHSANTSLTFEDGTQKFYTRDHPVTVLAEPEPEWVEGAWYWTEAPTDSKRSVRQRLAGGWADRGTDASSIAWSDSEDAITVLGRVLIVDWPGDDAAEDIVEASQLMAPSETAPMTRSTFALADAIRTQGGVR